MSNKPPRVPTPTIVGFRVSESDRLRLEFAAHLSQQRPSDLLRTALKRYLADAAIPESIPPSPSSQAA